MNGKMIPFGRIIQTVLFFLSCLPAYAIDMQQLHGQVPEFVKQYAPLKGHVDPSHIFHLSFALALRNTDQLQTLLQELYDPKSPLYRHWLSVEAFTSEFGPTHEDYQALQDFLNSHNLKVEKTFANRKIVSVVGTSGDIEKTLHVTMNYYLRPDGSTFYAPDREPSVEFQTTISHISGLDNAILARSSGFHPLTLPQKVIRADGSATGGACYWGPDFRNAYAPGVTLTGSGQVCAILAEDNYYPSDISDYISTTGIPANAAVVTNLYYSGITSTTVPNDGGETSLDIENCLSMAPGLEQLRVYLGTDGDQLLSAIASDNIAKSASTCFLWAPYDTTDTDDFSEMQAQGQSFYAGAGDAGAWATSGSSSSSGWLMELPDICVVGGTNLTMNGIGVSYASETGWNGSSGGISPDETIPSYQTTVPMTANGGSTTNRNLPDVSCVGDYVTIIYQQGTQLCLAGTSCATPLWNGFTALVNEQAALVGQPTLGFPNTPIYAIGMGPDYSMDFHDITSGNNAGSNNATGYNDVAGYDLVTGWGSPNGQSLINDLAGVGNPTPTQTYTATPTPTASDPCANWAVVGNATLGAAVTLTTATNGEIGAAWNRSTINLTDNFNLMFKAYFGATSGADGIDFVLQNDPRGISAIGEGGSDKGYSASDGGVSITSSVAFTLETYANNGTLQPEENGNDTSTCNYVLSGTCPYIFPNSVCNGEEHIYNVVWNATAQTLTLYFDGSSVMTYTRNLISSVFGGVSSVYYGFTAGTGGANNLQYVYSINCLTATNTPTSSPTGTSTKTTTPSSTPTATATNTSTNTLTATYTNTSTPTHTFTNTPTVTATLTHTATDTLTTTPAPTQTGTLTNTLTFTYTPTHTVTSLATNTFTNTPTPTQTGTLTNTPTLTPTHTNLMTMTASSTLTETSTSSPTFTPNRTTPCSSTPQWSPNQVVYEVTQEILYNGELYQCIQTNTSQPGITPSSDPSLWKDMGPCGVSVTSTASINGNPIIYPNPVTGSTTHIQLPISNAMNVKIKIFTTSFREVQTINMSKMTGSILRVPLFDKSGVPLANGLYYFLIEADGQKWITKVLILR